MDSPEATLALAVAEALRTYAEQKGSQQASAGDSVMTGADVVEDATLPAPRGPRQKEITDVLMGAPEEGLKTGAIARLIGMEQPNTYLTLQALQKQNIVELVPASDPQRWRLIRRYRQRHQILAAATLVEKGEFTTYGDISHMVYGHGRAGQAVGQVATKLGTFPNPHRVLSKGGAIPTGWTRPDGTGDPAAAAQMLRAEGVQVLEDDLGNRFAHPQHYVGWEQLSDRLRNRPATGHAS